MPKRRRTEDNSSADAASGTTPSEPIARSQEAWFEDGNIVLQAGRSQFKVHRGVLAKHSPVFADLFSIPHPSDEPTVEGCPIVELQDNPDDVKHVLLTLYGDPKYVMTEEPLHFLVISAMLRIGKKYEIQHLRDQALAVLKRELPTNLDDHDKVYHTWTHFKFPLDDIYDTRVKMHAEIVKLGNECGVQTIMPVAYLLLVAMDLDTLLEDPSALASHMLPKCLLGRERLLEAKAVLDRWTHDVGFTADCETPLQCTSLSRPLMIQLQSYSLDPFGILYPWQPYLDMVIEDGDTFYNLCNHCRNAAASSYQQARRAIWNNLPGYFGLPNWQNLKDLEA